MGRLVRRLVGEGALRVGRSFVEKRGKAGRDGDNSIEESGSSTGESRAKVHTRGGEGALKQGRRCAAVGRLVRGLVGERGSNWVGSALMKG